jgi:two-component system CheB/CheR fusion protein
VDDHPVEHVIAVGSSAGGIEALSVLVGALPTDIPAPVVVAQHLDPNRPSHLPEILRGRSELEIVLVEDEAELRPGTIYLLPPNTAAELVDGHVAVRARAGRGPAPSIDALFTSAAEAYGEGAVAVILTGTGTDGTMGARDVKLAGGIVVVQNPETAAFSGMPASIPPNLIDVVADLEAIGPLLNDLVTGTFAPARADEERLLRTFLDQVRDRSGIDFSAYKRATILRRLQRRMAATRTSGLREYVRFVQSHPDEYQRLTASFLIKVTEFFRDRDLFTYLRETVVPRLITEARSRGNELRLWSAGTATGEEAYSLAMLVADALGDELTSFNVRIFATDVDSEAIAFARRGIYPQATLDGLPSDVVERHFTAIGSHWEVKKQIRSITVFGQHDLGQRAPFPRVDLTLCRNVLIYFTPELQKRALQLFAFSLRDGGYLVLGKAESTGPLPEFFTLEQPRLKVYRRQGERVLIPPARIRDTTPLLPIRALPERPPAPAASARGREQRVAPERAESLLLRLPVGVVVVDRNYDIQTINAAARRLLAIHGVAVGEDLVHLVPDTAAAVVRGALDAAFRGDSPSVVVDLLHATADGTTTRNVSISCSPVRGESDGGPWDAVVVLATDVTTSTSNRVELEGQLQAAIDERERLAEHARALGATNSELVEANQELTTTNAELRSANEELLVANEEVQAATEEVETLNEELQATNEELETLNEELQATVEELNTTNDDLQARSLELQESAEAVAHEREVAEREREILARIVDGMPDPFVAVDRTGREVVANASYHAVFPAPAPELYDERGRPVPPTRAPVPRASAGEVVRMRLHVGAPDGPLYEVRSQPAEAGGDHLAVVLFRRVEG